MKFRPTQDNLVVEVGVYEVSAVVECAAELLVPKYTESVYILCEGPQKVDANHPGLRSVRPGQEPSNFLHSFRILVREGEIVIVSSRQKDFSKKQWRSFRDTLRANST